MTYFSVKYFLSKSWLVKFQTMAEPGEIDNSSVFCRHGGVRPQRIESAERLSKPLPPLAWRTLYQRYEATQGWNLKCYEQIFFLVIELKRGRKMYVVRIEEVMVHKLINYLTHMICFT